MEHISNDAEWGMYSPAGDNTITKKFNTLIDFLALDKANDYVTKISMFAEFIKAFRKIGESNAFGEASDTDVRDQVRYTLDKVAEEDGFDNFVLESLWRVYYD